MKTETWLCLYDLHYPKIDRPTVDAILDFLRENKVAGFLFGGDQFDHEEISHHTKGKGLYRLPGTFKKNGDAFDREILTPIEKLLDKKCHKVYIEGNHDHWCYELIEEHPELQGTIERENTLRLAERGWEYISMGQRFKHGELTVIHGEQLSGVGNQASTMHAKKALELFCDNVLYGHMHSPQSFTRVLPMDKKRKWMSWCSPIAGNTNPSYLENRPTSWLTGFTLVEFYGNKGHFNVYPVVTVDGQFAYGGKVYGTTKK